MCSRRARSRSANRSSCRRSSSAAEPGPARTTGCSSDWRDRARSGEIELQSPDATFCSSAAHRPRPGLVDARDRGADRPGDPLPQNDRGLAVVRGIAPRPRFSRSRPNGREDRLTRSLRATRARRRRRAAPNRRAADARCPRRGALRRCSKTFPAGASAAAKFARDVRRAGVRDLGGGLLMTGGNASFGVGGYHKSRGRGGAAGHDGDAGGAAALRPSRWRSRWTVRVRWVRLRPAARPR